MGVEHAVCPVFRSDEYVCAATRVLRLLRCQLLSYMRLLVCLHPFNLAQCVPRARVAWQR